MKTFSIVLGLVMCCVTGLMAQPATNPTTAPAIALPKRAPRIAEAPAIAQPAMATPVLTTAPKATNVAARGISAAPANPALSSDSLKPSPTTVAAPAAATPPAFPAFPTIPSTPRRTRPQLAGAPTNTPGVITPSGNVPAALPTPAATPSPNFAPGVPGAVAGAGETVAPENAPAAGPGGDAEVFPPGLIKFQDAELAQVLEIYQEMTGRTVLRPNNLPATKITIKSQTPLTRVEAIRALDSILSMNGIAMVPQGDKFVKAVVEAQVGTSGMVFSQEDFNKLPESGTPIWQIIKITNALPGDVAKALQPFSKAPQSILAIDAANVLVLRDYAENVKRMMEIIAKIDVVPVNEIKSVVIPIKYALAADIAQVLSTLTEGGGGATTVGGQTTRTGLTGAGGGFGGGARGGMGGGMGGGAYGGMGGYGNPGMGGQAGYNPSGSAGGLSGGLSSSAAGRSSFASKLQGIINKASGGEIVVLGETKIIADERTNSLLIFASKQDLASISNIIGQLDVVLAQVLIEALIFEVSLNKSLDYGVSYLQKNEAKSGDISGIGALINGKGLLSKDMFSAVGSNSVAGGNLPGGFSYLAHLGKDLDVAATAIAGDSRFNVLSRPRIQTSHAVEANLFVGRTRPYPTGTSYGGYYGGGGGYNSIQQLQIGITLSVLPLINPDGLVVMDIRQRTQSVGQDIEIANVGKVPETIDREANAKVAVRDRETIVLGGFISSEKKKSASGIPLLKDIPVLGHLFRSTSKSNDRQELMILIRPTVLPKPTDAAALVAEEKRLMPGIHAAEKEFKRESKETEKKLRDLEAKEEKVSAEREAKEDKVTAEREARDIYKREGFRQ